MTISDQLKHQFCLASIRKKTRKPYNFEYTRFYESNAAFYEVNTALHIELAADELIICSTIINADNYSILTTQRLLTKEKGAESSGLIAGATYEEYGNVKAYKGSPITQGAIRLHNGVTLKFFIEKLYASMVMIHGLISLIRTAELTQEQIEKITRIRERQNRLHEK